MSEGDGIAVDVRAEAGRERVVPVVAPIDLLDAVALVAEPYISAGPRAKYRPEHHRKDGNESRLEAARRLEHRSPLLDKTWP